jgi:hypothetical protein
MPTAPELLLGEYEPEAVALATYDKLISDLLASANGGPAALASAVEAAYDRLDMRFLERVTPPSPPPPQPGESAPYGESAHTAVVRARGLWWIARALPVSAAEGGGGGGGGLCVGIGCADVSRLASGAGRYSTSECHASNPPVLCGSGRSPV